MSEHATLGAVLGIFGAWGIVFFGVLAVQEIPITYKIVINILASIGFFIFGVVYFHKKHKKPKPIKASTSPVILDVNPLVHVKGTGKDVKPSQMILGSYGHVDGPRVEYLAKFGVIRVKAIKGEVLDCRANAKIKITHLDGKYDPYSWEDIGSLNWFSQSRRDSIDGKFDRLDELKEFGLNRFLRNDLVDIQENEEKDLLVLYMIKGLNKLFLCTTGDAMIAGFVQQDKFLEFILELSLSARNYSTTTWRYIVRILWDDFTFKPLQQVAD